MPKKPSIADFAAKLSDAVHLNLDPAYGAGEAVDEGWLGWLGSTTAEPTLEGPREKGLWTQG